MKEPVSGERYKEKLERLREYCKKKDQRLTVQKRRILEVLLEETGHPTADDIYSSVKERVPGLSRATVYRILEMLTDADLVRKVYHPEDQYRYDARTSRHHHLVCNQCSKVMDVELENSEPPELPGRAREKFSVQDYSVYFQGICKKCEEQLAGEETR